MPFQTLFPEEGPRLLRIGDTSKHSTSKNHTISSSTEQEDQDENNGNGNVGSDDENCGSGVSSVTTMVWSGGKIFICV